MSLTLIKSNPTEKRTVQKGTDSLHVSEFFCDTIQGEGIHAGHPAAFLRLQGCTLNCNYCDTSKVWSAGNPYTVYQLLRRMKMVKINLISKLYRGQHLVITGGSPLKQQEQLLVFINTFIEVHGFKPYIEIENECVISPNVGLSAVVDCWNNSPKLLNSGNKNRNYGLLRTMSGLHNSWFKFVVSEESDWKEIYNDYIEPGHIKKSQIILMPKGENLKELLLNRLLVVNLAIKNNVRYSTREHVVLWDTKVGV